MGLGKIISVAGLLGFAALGTAAAANVTFDANGTFEDGSILGGTIVIDTLTGAVDIAGVNLTVTGGTSDNFTFDELEGTPTDYNVDATDNFFQINVLDSAYSLPKEQPAFESIVPVDPILTFMIPIGSNTSLAGFAGSGSLCSNSLGNCESGNYFSDWNLDAFSDLPAGDPLLTSGSLTPGTAPEPASLLLLAAPLALLIRRQRAAAIR
jgi:hypothetical protein